MIRVTNFVVSPGEFYLLKVPLTENATGNYAKLLVGNNFYLSCWGDVTIAYEERLQQIFQVQKSDVDQIHIFVPFFEYNRFKYVKEVLVEFINVVEDDLKFVVLFVPSDYASVNSKDDLMKSLGIDRTDLRAEKFYKSVDGVHFQVASLLTEKGFHLEQGFFDSQKTEFAAIPVDDLKIEDGLESNGCDHWDLLDSLLDKFKGNNSDDELKFKLVPILSSAQSGNFAYLDYQYFELFGVEPNALVKLQSEASVCYAKILPMFQRSQERDKLLVSNDVWHNLKYSKQASFSVVQDHKSFPEASTISLELLEPYENNFKAEVLDVLLLEYFTDNSGLLIFTQGNVIKIACDKSRLIYGLSKPVSDNCCVLYFLITKIEASQEVNLHGHCKFNPKSTSLSWVKPLNKLETTVKFSTLASSPLIPLDVIIESFNDKNLIRSLKFFFDHNHQHPVILLDSPEAEFCYLSVSFFCNFYGLRLETSRTHDINAVTYLEYNDYADFESTWKAFAVQRVGFTIIRMSYNDNPNLYNRIKKDVFNSVELSILKNDKLNWIIKSLRANGCLIEETVESNFDSLIQLSFLQTKNLLKDIKHFLKLNPLYLFNSKVLSQCLESYNNVDRFVLRSSVFNKYSLIRANVTLDEIGGLEEAKNEIFDALRSNSRKGILFYGPPGNGKTLLAKAMSSSLNSSFLQVKGPELMNMYVGETEKSIRDLFSYARSLNRCVIFFDEIDALLGSSKAGQEGSDKLANRIVSQFILEMDRIDNSRTGSYLIVVGATNRLDMLEGRLLRPGRFDRHILIEPPKTVQDKLSVLSSVLTKLPLDEKEFSKDKLEQKVKQYLMNVSWSGAEFYGLSVACFQNTVERIINEIPDDIDRKDWNKFLMERTICTSEQDFVNALNQLLSNN